MSWLYTVLFAGLLFTSQGSTPATRPAFQNDGPSTVVSSADETEKFDQTYPLTPDGRVALLNVNGSITIEAWDRNEVVVSYVKSADTKEHLAEVDVKIDAKPDSIRIEADYGDWKNNRGNGRLWGSMAQVEFHLKVPRGANLNSVETVNGSVAVSNLTNFTKVSAVNGTVNAANLRGTANLSTVNGEIAADFDELATGSKIALNTVNGRVKLVIPSDANATFKADSLNGTITNDFGLPVHKGQYIGRDLYGRVGSGDVQIKLNSVNGGLAIGRKNDGKTPNPATNLLPQKKDNDEYWDKDNEVNKEVAKAVKDADKQIKAIPYVTKISADAVKRAAEVAATVGDTVKVEEIKQKIKEARSLSKIVVGVNDAIFMHSVPRVEKKSEVFAVTGVPSVTVNAKGCSVTVRGWDRSEVQYRVVRYSDANDQTPIKINEDHSPSSVNVTIEEPASSKQNSDDDQHRVHVEIFVPHKTNLKIKADGEIRLDGVSGDVDLSGGDGSINIRDSGGKLNVTDTDGSIRVIGFSGDVTAETNSGAISLEGDFQRLKTRAGIGGVTLTLPDGTNADIETTATAFRGEGISLVPTGGNENLKKFRIGKGGPIFRIETDGEVQVRSSEFLRASL